MTPECTSKSTGDSENAELEKFQAGSAMEHPCKLSNTTGKALWEKELHAILFLFIFNLISFWLVFLNEHAHFVAPI